MVEGFGSLVPPGDGMADARAAVGVVRVLVCAADVWTVTVVVVRPPADRVSDRTEGWWYSTLGDCTGPSLDSEMSELTDARLLGRLLPWLGPDNEQKTKQLSSNAFKASTRPAAHH